MVIILKKNLQNIYENYIKDYISELKIYYQKFKKKIYKLYRTLKYHYNNPKSNIGKKIVNFSHTKYGKLSFIIFGIFLISTLIFSIIKPSYSIYQKEHEFSFISAMVGNNEYDYNLLIYIEDKNNEGKYSLTENIPIFGYSYSGYKCRNNATLIYDENTKYTKVDLIKKDTCSIYFDYTSSADITIDIMLENNVNSNTYSVSKQIPYYGYKYSYYECDNNSTLTYDSNLHKINVETENTDVCKVYFLKEKSDIEVKLYVESTYESNDYIEKESIPIGKSYVLDTDKTECLNNNERTETEISYVDGYIEITSDEVTYCQVYLKLKNE